MRKLSIVIFILSTIYIFRSELFNLCITYKPTEEIEIVELTDKYWKNRVDEISNSTAYQGVIEFNDLIVSLVTRELIFSKNQLINDPNVFRKS